MKSKNWIWLKNNIQDTFRISGKRDFNIWNKDLWPVYLDMNNSRAKNNFLRIYYKYHSTFKSDFYES